MREITPEHNEEIHKFMGLLTLIGNMAVNRIVDDCADEPLVMLKELVRIVEMNRHSSESINRIVNEVKK